MLRKKFQVTGFSLQVSGEYSCQVPVSGKCRIQFQVSEVSSFRACPALRGYTFQGNTVTRCRLPVSGKYRIQLQVSEVSSFRACPALRGCRLQGNTGYGLLGASCRKCTIQLPGTGCRFPGNTKYSCRLPRTAAKISGSPMMGNMLNIQLPVSGNW